MKRLALPSLLVAATMVLPVAADARPIHREHYSGTDTFDFSGCGSPIHVEVTYDGVFMLKAPTKAGAPPRLFDNYHYTETLTANGKVLTIERQGLYKDLRITHVTGTIYRFVAMEAGQPFVVRDEDGNVLVHDRGVLRTSFLVDTKGDLDLENDEHLTWELVADHGRHPGFYLDFCDLLTDYFFG